MSVPHDWIPANIKDLAAAAPAPDRPREHVLAGLRGTDDGPDLVQLLTPEGERIATPEFDAHVADVDTGSCGLYRDMVLVRRVDSEATALQRQGELGLWAPLLGPGGGADRHRPGARDRGHGLPELPRARRRLVPGRRPDRAAGLFRGIDHGGWDPHAPASTSTRSSSATRASTPPATRWGRSEGRSGRRRRAGHHCLFGDGATSQGDVHEALRLGRRLRRARRLLLPEQPVGDLSPPSARPGCRSTAARRATASRASGSTATTCSPAWP